jgi:hypothetical protein
MSAMSATSDSGESGRPTLPTLHVDGGAELALTRRALATLDGEPLARFLAPRRWFGGKGGAVGRARIADVIPLDLAPPAAVAVIEVGGGAPGAAPAGSSGATQSAIQRYQLPLVVRQVGSDNGASGPVAVLARVETRAGTRCSSTPPKTRPSGAPSPVASTGRRRSRASRGRAGTWSR